MSVAGGHGQHRREISVLVGLGEHRRRQSTGWFGEKREPGNIAAWTVWDKKRKPMCYRRKSKKHRAKNWKRAGFLCPTTHRTTILCRSPITECQWGIYEYSGDT